MVKRKLIFLTADALAVYLTILNDPYFRQEPGVWIGFEILAIRLCNKKGVVNFF